MRNLAAVSVIFALWWPLSLAASDAIYRVVQPDGSVRYTDRPLDTHAAPLPLGTVSGTVPRARKQTTTPSMFYTAEALRAAARFAVSVESPTPGQVLAGDNVVAAASVMPGLVSGFTLIYHLDGVAATDAPVEALSVLLPPLAPGAHHLSISVLDGAGREVAHSDAVDFRVLAP